MIQDSETNLLYLADCLPKKNPAFTGEFLQLLNHNYIKYKYLPNTKDIWAVDYMPLQLELNKFVNFIYNPDYLQTIAGSKTISDVPAILKEIGITATNSDIVLDGGNVVKNKNTVILCDKVFKENPRHNEKDMIKKLEEIFNVDRIIFLPTHKDDFTGHADGMVRFIDNETLLINRYVKEDRKFQLGVRMALHNAGFETIELPYNPYNNPSNDDACGIYINYLEMNEFLIVPIFNLVEDEEAVKLIEELFGTKKILTLNSIEIARKGGILNCISWNIKVL
ncbi:MAG: agmatine deiminase family protein [Mucilaginibacter sp.]|uniref:agmatine deiminase family protein n=1 Tax=Mucilaginibacter sp. TaxID=1882438 RepID=UPI003265ECBD